MSDLTSRTLTLGGNTFELLLKGQTLLGLGTITIGDATVRSGRLPISPVIQTYSGLHLHSLSLIDVVEADDELRINMSADFIPLPTKLMRDHSFDPIHDTSDWDQQHIAGSASMSLVIRNAVDAFNGIQAKGFSYHWEYSSDDVEIFYILDRASWELDGSVVGSTVVSQSSCSDPLITFEDETAWTTEGVIHWDPDCANPIMTHNLPRWASHQAFDFQWKQSRVLLGIYEHVELIRSLLKREAGQAELKTFDKHLFDQAASFQTTPKKILLAEDIQTNVQMQNLWTWVFDEVHSRARDEFGLKEEPVVPRVGQNYWVNFTVDTYFKDLLPATAAIGGKAVFIDNLKKSAMTDQTPFPGKFNWNMCCGHEYEIAPELGGNHRVKHFVEQANAMSITPVSWTNNAQALSSPINQQERDGRNWFVKMEDTRLKYGGAYSSVFSILNFANDEVVKYFIDSHVKIKEETGLNAYLFDSFYNLGFMPIDYSDARPTTMWRQLLNVLKKLQDADVHFTIESFGPFGVVQHGCPRSYSIDRAWVCYKVCLGNDYTTVPSGKTYSDPRTNDAAALYFTLAHMVQPPMPLFKDGVRIDDRWGEAHRQALADYHAALPYLSRRYLQTDGKAVIWHAADGKHAVVFSFEDQRASFAFNAATNLTTGEKLSANDSLQLHPQETYLIETDALPETVTSSSAVEQLTDAK